MSLLLVNKNCLLAWRTNNLVPNPTLRLYTLKRSGNVLERPRSLAGSVLEAPSSHFRGIVYRHGTQTTLYPSLNCGPEIWNLETPLSTWLGTRRTFQKRVMHESSTFTFFKNTPPLQFQICIEIKTTVGATVRHPVLPTRKTSVALIV